MATTVFLSLVAAFLFMNAWFVAAEFALLAAPRPLFEHRAKAGDGFARRVLNLLRSADAQDRYVATAQLGITVASLGLGMYAEHELAHRILPWLGPLNFSGAAAIAGGISLATLTFAHIVLGEMVPKTVALQHPTFTARLVYWPMRVTLIAFYPIVAVSSGVARLCLRAVGIKRVSNTKDQVYTPEELQLIVEESQEGGAIRAESGRILRELFEFGDLVAKEVMVPRVRVVGIPVGATPADLRRLVSTHHRTRYPIFQGDLDHIIGMLHVKDVLRRLIQNEPVTTAEVRRLPVVPETAPLDDVLATMRANHAHLAIVIDEHGGTAGIISLEDLFEEVVGDIDEGESTTLALQPQPDGTVRASGTLRLAELGRFFDLDLEHEEVDSVSGLVLARLDRPPVVGDVVDYDRLRLEVIATSGRGVKEVRASIRPPDETTQ